jgi:hypothetical protein
VKPDPLKLVKSIVKTGPHTPTRTPQTPVEQLSVEQLNIADLDEQCQAAVKELECRALPWNGIVRTVRANLHKDSVQRRWVPMVDTSGSMEDERYDGQPMPPLWSKSGRRIVSVPGGVHDGQCDGKEWRARRQRSTLLAGRGGISPPTLKFTVTQAPPPAARPKTQGVCTRVFNTPSLS